MDDKIDDNIDDGATPTASPGDPRLVEFDPETDSAARSVVTAVADRLGTAPTSLDPLYDTIDPEALDRTITSVATQPGPGDAEIRIRYHGHTLTVHSYGFVEIAPEDDDRE